MEGLFECISCQETADDAVIIAWYELVLGDGKSNHSGSQHAKNDEAHSSGTGNACHEAAA